MQYKRINVGPELGDQERYPVNHQATDEVHVAAEAIQLGDPEVIPVLLRVHQGGSELRMAVQGIVSLARVDLDKFVNDVEALGPGQIGPTPHVARTLQGTGRVFCSWHETDLPVRLNDVRS